MIKDFARNAIKTYNIWLNKRPYLSNCVSAGLLMVTGDVLAQTVVERRKEPYSLMRTIRMGIMGVAIVSPAVLTFYRLMEQKIGPNKPYLKVVIDQAVFAPFMLAIFMPTLDFLSGYSWDFAKNHLKNDYVSILKANWVFWPVIQIINFSLMPAHSRLVFVQTVALFWNTYLAWKLHEGHEQH